jgi:fumarylacetoacetase
VILLDLGALQQLNYFEGIELTDDMFMQDTLNDFISDGKKRGDWYVIVS